MSAEPSGCDETPASPQTQRRRELTRLLAHPAIWRGRNAARTPVWPTGFPLLDEALPGGGWPQSGLIEILPARFSMGELTVLLPVLSAVTRRLEARWCMWMAPPLQPFAPALERAGIALQRLLIVRAARRASLWAFEQALGCGACDVVLAWSRHPGSRPIRRLQLAAQQGGTLGILFRPREAAREASAATLRMTIEPLAGGARIRLLKSRGGARGPVDLIWDAGRGEEHAGTQDD